MKCSSLPAKADTALQNKYYSETLHPLMKKAESGDIVLLFGDASHFVLGCDFLGYIYGSTRRFIKTFSGRKRYNVLGALDYISKKVVTVTNDSYITATEVCLLLHKIAESYSGKEIHLVLDNARYQKCHDVQDLAKELNIVLEYLPPYSPNLNLIERLWKYVKGELRSKYYDDFTAFQEKIDNIIDSTANHNRDKIDRLIGEKVELYDDLRQVAENTFIYNDCQEILAA